jgi:NADPH:quinone reductase-like Zn-dependent oxidoreductase
MSAPPAQATTTMRAIVRDEYGPPEVLGLQEIPRPDPTDDGVLVRVRAASVNPVDWHMLLGWPYLVRVQQGLRRPKRRQLGVDFAGTVESVGANVTAFRPGDEVFGMRSGAFGEYVCVEQAVALKPTSLTFEQAAAVPIAAVTALQGLRDKGRLQPGHRVLINGASGGVGTFAVQIAKALGAEVTGVCSTRNVELVRSLGADHVVDYTREDFTRGGERFDLLLDVAGGRSWSECTRVLTPDATVVLVGGPKVNRLTGISLRHLIRLRWASLTSGRKGLPFLANVTREELEFMGDLLETGKVESVLDGRYELGEVPEALRYLAEGHARGKVVVTV